MPDMNTKKKWHVLTLGNAYLMSLDRASVKELRTRSPAFYFAKKLLLQSDGSLRIEDSSGAPLGKIILFKSQ